MENPRCGYSGVKVQCEAGQTLYQGLANICGGMLFRCHGTSSDSFIPSHYCRFSTSFALQILGAGHSGKSDHTSVSQENLAF